MGFFPAASIAAFVLVSTFAASMLKTCFGTGKDVPTPLGSSTVLKTLVGGSAAEVKKVISRKGIKASITQLQKLELPREVRRRRNRIFVRCLADSQAKAFTKLKGFPNKETCQQIMDDFTHSPSCMGKLKDTIENQKDAMKKKYHACTCTLDIRGINGHCRYEQQCCKPGPQPTTDGLGSIFSRIRKMVASYVDLVRDIILVVFIIDLGLFSADITLFQNVVIWILIATVAVPLVVSAVQTSARHPLTIFEFPVWQNFTAEQPGRYKFAFIRLLVFFCYIFMPAILINNKEKAKLRRQVLEEQGKEEYDSKEGMVTNETLEEQEQIETYLDEVRKTHLVYKKNEAALELVAQQSIQLTMLLLSMTKYPVASGLQGIFGKDFSTIVNFLGLDLDLGDFLLLLSVSWSFRTGALSFLKIHSEQKAGMLSGAAKVVLGLRALLFSVIRIGCIVAFFGPFLGLKDCMAHWHAEKFELEGELLKMISPTPASLEPIFKEAKKKRINPDYLKTLLQDSNSFWEKETVDLLYREQDLTNYTLVTLQTAFFVFLGVLLLHGIAIFILKINVSWHFKSTGWLNKMGHVLESLHVPDVYKDFDVDLDGEEERTTEQYQMSYNSVLTETLWMICLQMVSNILLLVPLLVAGECNISLWIRLNFHPFRFQGEGETLCSGAQHWYVCKGGRSVRAVEPQQVAALHHHGDQCPRCPPGGRLPQLAPPLEDHSARGKASLAKGQRRN